MENKLLEMENELIAFYDQIWDRVLRMKRVHDALINKGSCLDDANKQLLNVMSALNKKYMEAIYDTNRIMHDIFDTESLWLEFDNFESTFYEANKLVV